MDNLKASVEAAGARMSDVLKCTCFLSEASGFAALDRTFSSYFAFGSPARYTAIVKQLVVPGAELEIDRVACLS